jgi:hydroxypyruvate reductase
MVSRQNILEIFHAALEAVRPGSMIRRAVAIRGNALVVEGRHFELPPNRPIPVFGCGKAALAAANALAAVLSDRFGGGFVITNDYDGTPVPVDVHIGAHPLADERSLCGPWKCADVYPS